MQVLHYQIMIKKQWIPCKNHHPSSPIEYKTTVTLNNISNDYMVVITAD